MIELLWNGIGEGWELRLFKCEERELHFQWHQCSYIGFPVVDFGGGKSVFIVSSYFMADVAMWVNEDMATKEAIDTIILCRGHDM